jgi:hypothetical protein
MTTPKNSKPVMAEMLVRHVFGEAENFERLCAQRGMSVEEAVVQALRGWIGHGLTVVQGGELVAETDPVVLLLPDPADCPQGQEAHWLGVIEHDLDALKKAQRRCFQTKDAEGLQRTNQSIETYIQAQAALRDRVA